MEIVCAKCRKPYVQAVRQQGTLDRLLSLAYVYPFRCQVCRHRFRLMQWGLRYNETEVDRRQYRRRPVRLHVILSNDHGEHEGTVTDISMGGCAIETTVPLFKEKDLLTLRLDAFDLEPPIIVESAIVRPVSGPHIGLEFLRLDKKEEERLSQFILNLWLEGTQMARKGIWQDTPRQETS